MPSETRNTTTAHRNRLSSRFDHWLFFIVFVVGSGGIIVLKQRGYEQWIVTGFPVVMMLVYALYATATRRYLLREDQVGDNLYYLGFLYTLVSLGYSLFLFAGDADSTAKIIANFGVALTTTIVGLAMRVLFNQMREDPVEIEREARVELGDAVSRLKSELDTSVIELNSFRRATVQSLAEGMTEISDKANVALEEHTKRLSDMVEHVLELVGGGTSMLQENQKQLTAAARRTVNAVEKLAQRIDSIDVPNNLIDRKLDPALDALSKSASEMAAHTQAQGENSDRLNELFERAINSSMVLDERLTALVQQADGQRQSLAAEFERLKTMIEGLHGALLKSLTALREGADQQGQILSTLSEHAEQHLKFAERHRERLEEELEKSRASVAELHGALVSMTGLLTEKLDGR